jgi:hypothetical protein
VALLDVARIFASIFGSMYSGWQSASSASTRSSEAPTSREARNDQPAQRL